MKEYSLYSVVIPIYNSRLDYFEEQSLLSCVNHLKNVPVCFVAPHGLDCAYYLNICPSAQIQTFSPAFFADWNGYNRLMLSVDFYLAFNKYEYILICQTDVFVFSNIIEDFIKLNYDYMGAPLIKLCNDQLKLYGGNGGLSLRKVGAFVELLHDYENTALTWDGNEDEFFSQADEMFGRDFSIAPISIAASFSFDRFARVLYKMNGRKLPVGYHGWYKYDQKFAKSIIAERTLCEEHDAVKALQNFLANHNSIVLYGCGMWGKVMLQYMEKIGRPVTCFIVSSEEHAAHCTSYHNVEVVPIARMDHSSVGVIISLSKRACSEKEYKSVVSSCYANGFIDNNILHMDVVLYNQVCEVLLQSIYTG